MEGICFSNPSPENYISYDYVWAYDWIGQIFNLDNFAIRC